MKVTVKDFIYVRVGKPSVNAPAFQYLAPGSILDVDGKLYKGDQYEGVDTWLKDEAGNYYWSGGVEKETTRSTLLNDPKTFWWLNDYGIPDVWATGLTGNGIKIAVLDTGISYPHPDLKLDNTLFEDVTNSASGTNDLDGHGTHCVGIIKGFDPTFGPFGLAHNATIYVCKITHDEAGDDDFFLIKGIQWAIDKGVDLISISKGNPVENSDVEAILKKANDIGILVVAAAGNKTPGLPDNHIYYPARYKSTLSVGGLDNNRKPLVDSILTGETSIFAPGKQILSTHLNSGLVNRSGSSQAAPFVTGVCALILEHHRKNKPSLKANEIRTPLLSASDTIGNLKLVNIKNIINQNPS